MKKYKFVGEGAGVPGLPHEITEEEAEALGLSELLEAAVENGNYREEGGGLQIRREQGIRHERKMIKKDSEVSDE